MNGHAPRGGCIAVNGEFYEGGKFLPSNPNRAKGMSTSYKSGKVEIEPYVWKKYEGELRKDEVVNGFFMLLCEDFKDNYKYQCRIRNEKDDYEEYIKPYKTAWNEGKRFRIFIKGNPDKVRFE